MAVSTSKKERRPRKKREYLPESDGTPMAETDVHRQQMIDLLDSLTEYFRSDPKVYVTGNIFLYLPSDKNFPNEPRQSVSPDIFVVKGIKKKARRIYDMAVEKKSPDVVIELVSRSTRVDDMGKKRFLYAEMGVAEYFVFDPLKESLDSQLHGFRLIGGEYVSLSGLPMDSEVLGLALTVEDRKLRLYHVKTGQRLRTHEEEAEARRQAEAKATSAEAKATLAEAKATLAEAKAGEETRARQKAEAEIARLREALEKLRDNQD